MQFVFENLGVNLNFVSPVYSCNKKVSNGGQFKSWKSHLNSTRELVCKLKPLFFGEC